MTAHMCRESDSHSVLLANVAEVLERCETGEPVIDRPAREGLAAGVAAASVVCGYRHGHNGVPWLRGRSRGVRP